MRQSPNGERGQMIILMTLAIVIIVGVAALAIDGSFMYEKRNRLHAAADAGAMSAAIEVRRGNTRDVLRLFVEQEVTALGFHTSVVQAVNCSGTCDTDSFVEVILAETTSTFLASVLGFASMTPTARAVAGWAASRNCLTLLGSSGGLHVENGATITATGCNILINATDPSTALFVGTANVAAAQIGVVGGYNHQGNVTPTPIERIPPASDPLVGLSSPTPSGTCTTVNVGVHGSENLSPGTYCSWFVGSGGTLNLSDGTYILQGDITIDEGASINGIGAVTIYKQFGILQMNNNSSLNLVAPTTGSYPGIAYWQPTGNASQINIRGNATYNVSGVTYAPDGHFYQYEDGEITGACFVLLVKSMFMESNATVTMAGNCAHFDGIPLKTVSLAE